MQIGINDLDDDDFGTGFESSQQVIETPEVEQFYYRNLLQQMKKMMILCQIF